MVPLQTIVRLGRVTRYLFPVAYSSFPEPETDPPDCVKLITAVFVASFRAFAFDTIWAISTPLRFVEDRLCSSTFGLLTKGIEPRIEIEIRIVASCILGFYFFIAVREIARLKRAISTLLWVLSATSVTFNVIYTFNDG